MPSETILETIFYDRKQGVLATRNEKERQICSEIQSEGNEDALREQIEKIYNKKLRRKINKYLELTLDDMLKRESVALDKYYKQGFKDGINLLIECIE